MKAITVRRAQEDDAPIIMGMWTAAADRLHAQGHDQWNYPVKVENIRRHISAGACWTVHGEGPDPIGTVTVDDFADPTLWTTEDAPGDALYVHRMVLIASARGDQLGSALLDWAALRADGAGKSWLRLDAWTTNLDLQRYYFRHGFAHVRTVAGDGIASGALFQRPSSVRLGLGPTVTQRT